MVLFKDFSSSAKKYLVVTKESNDAKEADISMLFERPIIGRFTKRWPELKDSRDIVEWIYDVSWNSDSFSRAWSLHSSLYKNTTESRYLVTLGRRIRNTLGHPFKINGEWSYIPLYWEWLEDVLVRSRQTLNKAHTFTSLQSSFSSCMTPELRDKKLTEYKIQLDDQLKVEGELLAHGGALKDGLVNTNSKIAKLQEELK